MFAMHAQTAAPIRTKLGTSLPSVPGVVIGRSNLGSGCPKTREDQKKQAAGLKNQTRHEPENSAPNRRSRTLNSKRRDATSSSYLQTLTTFFLIKTTNVKPTFYNLLNNRNLEPSSSRTEISFPGRRRNDLGSRPRVPEHRRAPPRLTRRCSGTRRLPGGPTFAREPRRLPGNRANVGVLGQTSGSRADVGLPGQTSGFPGRRRGSRANVGPPGNRRVPGQSSGPRATPGT